MIEEKKTIKFIPHRCLPLVIFLLTAAFALMLLIMLMANTLHPGCIGPFSSLSFFRFTPEWGSRRGATWMAGFLAFAEQGLPGWLVGVGPDCMASYTRIDASITLKTLISQTFGPNRRLTSAHCELITILVNTGILGLLSFCAMIGSFLRRTLLRKDFVQSKTAAACGICVLAYCINNLVSFEQAVNCSIFYLLLGAGSSFLRSDSH